MEKVKGKKSSTCHSASYTRRARDQKRFTISEVAADRHELMMPQHTMRPSITPISGQLDSRFAQAHITGTV